MLFVTHQRETLEKLFHLFFPSSSFSTFDHTGTFVNFKVNDFVDPPKNLFSSTLTLISIYLIKVKQITCSYI